MGETRGDKEVIGFHNWIQFYLQEKAKNVDYKGFMSSDRVIIWSLLLFYDLLSNAIFWLYLMTKY